MFIHLYKKPVVDDGYMSINAERTIKLAPLKDRDERCVAKQLLEINLQNKSWTAVELHSLLCYFELSLMRVSAYEHSTELSWQVSMIKFLRSLFSGRFLEGMIIRIFMKALLRLADRKMVELRDEEDGKTYVYPLPKLAEAMTTTLDKAARSTRGRGQHWL